MTRTSPQKVTIAVLTYKRPGDLVVALPQLLDQLATVVGESEVLVIDNDPEASARTTVEGHADSRLRYAHEPKPGIAAGRNRALDEAADSDIVVFIDDDERPVDNWLAALLEVHGRDRPAAVVGPVESEFAVPPDPWIVAGGFFTRRRPSTGTVVDVAATNNLLLDVAQLRELDLRFDERFGLSGGSDTLFSRELVRRGARMVWCAEAMVVDAVPAERVTRSWVLRRSFRSGNTWSRTTTALAGSTGSRLVSRARMLGSGSLRLVAGGARVVLGMVSGSVTHRAQGMRAVARGAGMFSGALGYVFMEYGRGSTQGWLGPRQRRSRASR